jgi:hypothetical protein
MRFLFLATTTLLAGLIPLLPIRSIELLELAFFFIAALTISITLKSKTQEKFKKHSHEKNRACNHGHGAD